ncbi:MAG: radical SAM protein, partial [Endomicrobiia bacterium]|nr:radical SAM protein [Endomicrobiia bacterium]
ERWDEKTRVLADKFGRTISYIRVSVTDRCNLNCLYCSNAGRKGAAQGRESNLPRSEILTFEEIFFVAETARDKFGIENIRLTGGEPLARRGLAGLIKRLTAEGFRVGLTTNGTLLEREASNLKSAGLSRLNISLDTLSPEIYRNITGGDISLAMAGVEAARSSGFKEITVNAVARGGDYDDAARFLAWAARRRLAVKFIEEMPIGGGKSVCGSDAFSDGSVDARAGREAFDFGAFENELVKALGLISADNPGFGPGRYYRSGGSDAVVGFVAALSKPFCEKCNRVRLTADGKLLPCLGHPDFADIKKILRMNLCDAKKREAVGEAFEHVAAKKPKNHDDFAKAADIRMVSVGG